MSNAIQAVDAMTGLLSRPGLQARAPDWSMPLLGLAFAFHLKLAHFGIANILHGADAADDYLRRVAQRLRQEAPESALLARLWGAEFLCLCAYDSPASAIEFADSLRRAAAAVPLGGEALMPGLTVSVGVAFRTPDMSWEDLLTHAAVACDSAGEAGTNRVHVYDASGDSIVVVRSDLAAATQLRRMIAQEQLALYVQPIVMLDPPHRPVKVEVLLRKKGGDGIALPRPLIQGAERFHLMPELDRYVIEHAVEWLAQHPEVFKVLRNVSLNLSGQSISDRDLVEFLYHAARFGGVPAEHLCFEITETTAVLNLQRARELLNTLRDLGCRFSLDDFGAGVSSFGYLRQLEVDEVKIDGQFVREMGRDPAVREMVRAIHQVASACGLQTVAEFVEDEKTLQELREMGVHYGQGWHFTAAFPIEELPAYLERANSTSQ